MVALRSLAPSVFGILMSLEPAAAALAAIVVLNELLSPAPVAGRRLRHRRQRGRHPQPARAHASPPRTDGAAPRRASRAASSRRHNLRMAKTTPGPVATDDTQSGSWTCCPTTAPGIRAWTNDPDGTFEGPTVVLCNGLGHRARGRGRHCSSPTAACASSPGTTAASGVG